MKTFARRILLLGIIVALVLILWHLTPVGDWVDFRTVFENREKLLETVNSRRLLAALIYVGAYLAVTALSIPGATVLTLLGGFFFGPWLATLYINVGATAGAFIIFLATRYFIGEGIQKKYGEKIARFNAEVNRNGPNYFLTLRLIPLFPFFLVNLFAGLTTIRPRNFLWTTSLGIIPGSFTYAWLGYAGASIGDGPPWPLFVALGLLAMLSLAPVLCRRRGRSGMPR